MGRLESNRILVGFWGFDTRKSPQMLMASEQKGDTGQHDGSHGPNTGSCRRRVARLNSAS
jgi:hypothetical protein